MPPKTRLLVLSNALLDALATNPAVQANFGACFGGLTRRASSRGCGPCQQSVRQRQDDYSQIRNCLGQLPAAKKLLLKQLLNTEKLRLVVQRGTTQRIELTF